MGGSHGVTCRIADTVDEPRRRALAALCVDMPFRQVFGHAIGHGFGHEFRHVFRPVVRDAFRDVFRHAGRRVGGIS